MGRVYVTERSLLADVASGTGGAYGSFRTILAGPGYCLPEAMMDLERLSGVGEVARHPARNVVGARLALPPEEGGGYWNVTRIDEEMTVTAGTPAVIGKPVELARNDSLIQFYFKLPAEPTGAVCVTSASSRLNPTDSSEHPQERTNEWIRLASRDRFVAITVRTRYLDEHFLDSIVRSAEEMRAIVYPQAGTVRYSDLPLSGDMRGRVTQLLDTPYTGSLALIHTAAVTLEVLCAAVAGLDGILGRMSEAYSTLQLRRLHIARHMFLTQRSPTPTIREVARAAGMSETALKRGFRIVFGETLFDFSVRHRMREAFELLREGSLPVSRVADAVGYRHQASFASAFRKHFGLSPKNVRPTRTS